MANIAFIPARAGSKRLRNKNIMQLRGFPLIAYTIRAAIDSGIFKEIIVSTDSEEIASISVTHGAEVPMLRPPELATDTSSDIEWLRHGINSLISTPLDNIENIAILRPTSPLRKKNSILKAVSILEASDWADSIRGMERTSKHPGKMWILDEMNRAYPFLDQTSELIPTHNRPTQTLPEIWVQNASLEIVKLKSVLRTGSISGNNVIGFELPNPEGFDINTEEDWEYLQFLVANNPEILNTLK
jgi:CMP-N-acetylneuraminic acid synthetase